MKIPKTFTSEKNLDKTIKKLILNKPVLRPYNETTVTMLLKSCGKFMEKQKVTLNLSEVYNTGKDLAEKINFTKNDLEELVQRITLYDTIDYGHHEDAYTGFFISALVNKIIEENEELILKPDARLYGLGAYLKTSKLIIEGESGYFLCHCMEDGEVVINGNAGDNAGNGMRGGKLTINGDAGNDVGSFTEAGDIIVYRSIGKIAETCKARIYQWGKQVWPR